LRERRRRTGNRQSDCESDASHGFLRP
jgi:hypothetical protein